MSVKKEDKARNKDKDQVEEFWYDPMSYPAFLKKRGDKTPSSKV